MLYEVITCLSQLGKEQTDEMTFSDSFEQVIKQQQQTFEFRRICLEEDNFPIGYFMDVREPLVRIRTVGRYMDEKELFDLKRSLTTINDICRFFNLKEPQDYPHRNNFV